MTNMTMGQWKVESLIRDNGNDILNESEMNMNVWLF